jgi:hypothetical protein
MTSETKESRFLETRWTRVRKARSTQDSGKARVAFECLCRYYRRPLYAYSEPDRRYRGIRGSRDAGG